MSKNKTIRVYPNGRNWVVKKDGYEKASAIRNTKNEALQAARNIAINQNLTVIVHGSDGRIQRKWNPEEGEPEGDCFITTACTSFYGLSDDCYQLQTLRKFRDGYLSKSSESKKLIKQYYSVAPALVTLLKADSDRRKLFADIFMKINSACAALELKQYEEAKRIYIDAVKDLLNRYKVS